MTTIEQPVTATAPEAPSGVGGERTRGRMPGGSGAPRSDGWVAILVIVLGTVLVLAIGAAAFKTMFRDLGNAHLSSTFAAAAAEQVVIDANFAAVTLAYTGTGTEATVFAEGTTDQSELPVAVTGDDSVLRVEITGTDGWGTLRTDLSVHITMPAALAPSADVEVHVGSGHARVESPVEHLVARVDTGVIEASGAKEAIVEVNAGGMSLTGDYDRVELSAQTGFLDLYGRVAVAGTVDVGSGAGSIDLAGPMPAEFSTQVGTGFVDIGVPEGTYQVARSGAVDIDPSINPDGGADSPKLELRVGTGVISLNASLN